MVGASFVDAVVNILVVCVVLNGSVTGAIVSDSEVDAGNSFVGVVGNIVAVEVCKSSRACAEIGCCSGVGDSLVEIMDLVGLLINGSVELSVVVDCKVEVSISVFGTIVVGNSPVVVDNLASDVIGS